MLTAKFKIVLTLLFTCCFNLSLLAADRREYQHGIDFVPLPDGRYWLLWSSSPGDPPQGDQKIKNNGRVKCKYFNHDVYYSLIDPANPVLDKKLLLGLPEAQEPVSAAISSDGTVALTFEDGSESDIEQCNGIIQQRYQLFDQSLKHLSGLKKVTVDGAHSGHIASVGNLFVIAYAEGWDDIEGTDGIANDVHVDVIDPGNKQVRHHGIAVDNGSPRDWWPLVAGSDQYAVLVWQRYVPGSRYANLMFTVFDPESSKLIKEISLLKANVIQYHYDVQYLPGINRFLVVGNYVGDSLLQKLGRALSVVSAKPFAFLLDEEGNIVDQWETGQDCLRCGSYFYHPIVRESQPAMFQMEGGTKVLYPVKPGGLLSFFITASRITLREHIEGEHLWFPLGTDGIFLNENTAYFANLTQGGLRTIVFKLQ